MKRIVIICALLISAVSFTFAQGGRGPQGTPEERAQATLERPNVVALTLTADQKAKALPILVSYNKATSELMTKAQAAADPQAAMTEVRTQMTALGADSEKQLVALLTADQKKAYDTALAAAKEANPNATTVIVGGRGGRGGGR